MDAVIHENCYSIYSIFQDKISKCQFVIGSKCNRETIAKALVPGNCSVFFDCNFSSD